MIKEIKTKLEAATEWVNGFNAFPLTMLEELVGHNIDAWHEITPFSLGDRVYVFNFPEEDINKNDYEAECYGEISELLEDENFIIELDNGVKIIVEKDDFEKEEKDLFPMWGTMWQFGDGIDNWWLEGREGLQAFADCGFRIYEHDDYGCFFGIDGAGYDFYENHWIPLYEKRGLQWHDIN